MRRLTFAAFGALSGVVAATVCGYLRLGEPNPVEIAGYCIGLKPSSYSRCGTIDGVFYLFPGLVFGLVFGPLLRLRGDVSTLGAAGYAAAATLANMAAVFVCVSLMHPFDDLLPSDNPVFNLAVAGGVAGAAGSALLGAAFGLLKRESWSALPVAVGAGLGVLAPLMLMFERPGAYAFYILWQGSYAAAIGFSMRRAQAAAISPTA